MNISMDFFHTGVIFGKWLFYAEDMLFAQTMSGGLLIFLIWTMRTLLVSPGALLFGAC